MAWSLFANQPSYDGVPGQAAGQGAGILGMFPKAPAYDAPKKTVANGARAKLEAALSEDEREVHLRVHVPGVLSFEGTMPTGRLLLALCQALPFVSDMACGEAGSAADPNHNSQEEGDDDEVM